MIEKSNTPAEKTNNSRRYLMYMHAGSGNHGCEAIVRSLCSLTDADVTVLSHKADEDVKYGLSDKCRVIATNHVENHFFVHAFFYAVKKLTGRGEPRMKYTYKSAGKLNQYDLAISIGGDNYCYDETIYDLRMANSMFCEHNIPTALIGCSVEPELLEQSEIVEDMDRYKVIVARESITYNALLSRVRRAKIKLVPDPAFTMEPKKCNLPDGFIEGHTIGINVSPLILGYERDDAKGITLKNYEKLIETIIMHSSDNIALIPHVVWEGNDDREPLKILFEKYKDTNRVFIVDDCTAPELKYIISQCRLFIGARTHATIAAYSTCVPTLVVGYSVKSRGIAKDLFGTEENYVLPVQKLKSETDLAECYRWLEANAVAQKIQLTKLMPEYISRAREMFSVLKESL